MLPIPRVAFGIFMNAAAEDLNIKLEIFNAGYQIAKSIIDAASQKGLWCKMENFISSGILWLLRPLKEIKGQKGANQKMKIFKEIHSSKAECQK